MDTSSNVVLLGLSVPCCGACSLNTEYANGGRDMEDGNSKVYTDEAIMGSNEHHSYNASTQ